MLTPAYQFTIGRRVVDTTAKPQASTALDLTVALDIDTPADSFTLELGNADGVKPAVGDQVKVELGYADDGGLTQVMTGTVVCVEPAVETTRVVALSAGATLLRTFVEQTYESKTAGAIVRALAGDASVDVAATDDGITFPAYVIDGRRSIYHHMLDLADLSGFDLYLDPNDALVFQKFTGGKRVHVFEYTKHIVALDVARTPPRAGMVVAWGESPTGSQGDGAWAWLTKDFSSSKGTAGSGALLLLERPALRTKDAAGTAAAAALTTIQRRTVRGKLLTIGRPQVMLGDAISLQGLADTKLNTSFQVRSVTHRITKRGGFVTEIGFRAIEV